MLGVAVKVGVTDVVALTVGDAEVVEVGVGEGVGVALGLAIAISWPRLLPMYTV